MRGKVEYFREVLCKGINHRYFVPLCLVAGALLRLAWIWLVNVPQVSDYAWYYQRGLTIAEGHGYSVDGILTAYWPVGYPGFVGILFEIFGPSLFVAKVVNIALYLGTILLMYVLSKRLFHSEVAGRILILILSLYPNHIAYTALLSTEIFYAFLVALGAVSFVIAQERVGWFLLSGVSWGLAILTKPQTVLVPIIFLVVFCSTVRSMLKSGAVILVTLALTIAPWVYRNYLIFGKPLLSTNGGVVLFIGNNPYATGRQIWDQHVKSLLGDLGTDNMFDGKEVAREARAENIAIRYIEHHPWHTVLLWPKKFAALYASDVDGIYYSLGMMQSAGESTKLIYWGLRVAAELYYVLIIVLFGIALPTVWHSQVRKQQIGLFLAVYLTVVYLIFFGNARYHFALMPWIAMYSGIGGERFLNWYKRPLPESGRRRD